MEGEGVKESRTPAEGGKVLPLRIGKDSLVVKSCQLVSLKVMSFLIKRNFPGWGHLMGLSQSILAEGWSALD